MLKNYLKIAFKVFMRRKFFTAISLFGISFTLVVLMVFTAIFDHIFGPLPPETKADRTLGVFMLREETTNAAGAYSQGNGPPSYAFLDRYVRTLPEVEKVSISTVISADVNGASFVQGEKIESHLKHTDGEFWQILDFDFIEGGPFTPEDEKNASTVAVINASTRRRFFDKEPAVGKTIEASGQRFRVVGVVADVPILRLTPFADIWVPISTSSTKEYLKKNVLLGGFQGLILARSPADIPRIKTEFQSRLSQVEFPDPKTTNKLSGGAESFFETISRALFSSDNEESHPGMLMGALVGLMVLFMILPTLNLININMSRILERSSEIGVRKAFGASSWTLVGQFVVENVLLVLIGGGIGMVFTHLVLEALNTSDLLQYAQFHLNYRIFCYGLLTTLFFGVFSGVYPAWKMSRLQPVQALKGGVR